MRLSLLPTNIKIHFKHNLRKTESISFKLAHMVLVKEAGRDTLLTNV